MSDYDDDEMLSLDEMEDDDYSEGGSDDWGDDLDDQDSGFWGERYGNDEDDVDADYDPWALD